jgi:hypothetical protein
MTITAVVTEQGYELTKTGVRFLRPLTMAEYEDLGRRLSNFASRTKWALGDWLAAGEGIAELGNRFELAMRITGRTYETLRWYLQVALTFSHDERDLVPYAFYRAALRLPATQRFTVVQLAHQNHWTRADVESFIASRLGEDVDAAAASTSTTGARSRAPRRPRSVTCPHCGKSFVPGQTPPLEDTSTWGGGKAGA